MDAPPLPPQLVFTPFSRCFGGLHPNSQLDVRSKADGVVVGCNLFSTCVPQFSTGSFLCAMYHMKLLEVTLLELSLVRVVRGRL
jgi:hypothetical protein